MWRNSCWLTLVLILATGTSPSPRAPLQDFLSNGCHHHPANWRWVLMELLRSPRWQLVCRPQTKATACWFYSSYTFFGSWSRVEWSLAWVVYGSGAFSCYIYLVAGWFAHSYQLASWQWSLSSSLPCWYFASQAGGHLLACFSYLSWRKSGCWFPCKSWLWSTATSILE